MSPQEERDLFYWALLAISRYDAPGRLHTTAEKRYGLDGSEAVEYAYENVLETAKQAIKGRKKPKLAAKQLSAAAAGSQAQPNGKEAAAQTIAQQNGKGTA